MRFSLVTLLVTLSALASANTVEFINQDDTPRTIIFTAEWDQSPIPPMDLPASGRATQDFPSGWIGNFHAIAKDAADADGMLGELRWNGYGKVNYFDVSAIANPNDHDGIKTIYPKGSQSPMSGCESYHQACANAYNAPDDVQTRSTTESDLICTVGNKSSPSMVRRHPRHFISGHSLQ